MKWVFLILMMSNIIPVLSQDDRAIRKNARRERYDNVVSPGILARDITVACTTDLQKVKAIFYWITDNIAYRTRSSAPRQRKRLVEPALDETDDTFALKPLDERVAENVLLDGVAVCDGYARLFKTLCTYSGVTAEVVHGYARTEASKRIQRFRPNHSWNAVLIDSTWQLLDVTWASGYITWHGNEFVKQLDEQYFLTSPAQFIREHYPDDLKWALMDDPPLMPEFRHSPFRQKTFAKYNIVSYKPETGVIEVNEGDTVMIELRSSDYVRDRNVSSDPFLDTSIYNSPTTALLSPLSKGSFTVYSYVAGSPAIQWLYILYNDDVILRYRLKVKPEKQVPVASN